MSENPVREEEQASAYAYDKPQTFNGPVEFNGPVTGLSPSAIADVPESSLIGRRSGTDGSAEIITLDPSLVMTGNVLSAVNGGITNSAGLDVIPKSVVPNLVGSDLLDHVDHFDISKIAGDNSVQFHMNRILPNLTFSVESATGDTNCTFADLFVTLAANQSSADSSSELNMYDTITLMSSIAGETAEYVLSPSKLKVYVRPEDEVFNFGIEIGEYGTIAGIPPLEGKTINIIASSASSSLTDEGAAQGGDVRLIAGNANNYVSGSANGGSISLIPGIGSGPTGQNGVVFIDGNTSTPFESLQIGGMKNGVLSAGFDGGIVLGIPSSYASKKTYVGYRGLGIPSDACVYWVDSDFTTDVPDTCLSRLDPATVGVGSGTLGTYDGEFWAGGFGIAGNAFLSSARSNVVNWGRPSATPPNYVHYLSPEADGADIVGSSATSCPGFGTGNKPSGDYAIGVGAKGTSGSSLNTLVHRNYVVSGARTLVSGAAAVGFVEIRLPFNNSYAGYEIHYAIGMADGTNCAIHVGKCFGAVYRNGAGTVSGNIPTEGSETNHNSSGGNTSDTFTVTAGAGKLTVNIAATKGSGVGSATLSEISYQILVNGYATIVPLNS